VTDGVGRSVESPLAPRPGAHFSGIVAAITGTGKFAGPPSQSSARPGGPSPPAGAGAGPGSASSRGRDRALIVGRTVRLASRDLLNRWPGRDGFRVEIPL
jgi:hypothetical protein